MPEISVTVLNSLADTLAEKNKFINHLHEEIRLTQDRLADCAKQKDITRNDEYVAELREDNERLSHLNRQQVKELEKLQGEMKELRKEKEHYEKVAQEMTDKVLKLENEDNVLVEKLRKEIEELGKMFRAKASCETDSYKTGKQHGYDEALAKSQDAILNLRK